MLKLQKLELRGFKSFCDFTEITFNEAITGVVGPNGCGKSNIADAMSWVLGEQSARLLRGSKMEDVIFQGSGVRPPVNLAEVSLSFRALADLEANDRGSWESSGSEEGGNGEGASLPKRFDLKIRAGETVVVSRRLYRSGESEYLVNGRQVRLKDVRDLFAGTGLGPGHYALIGQGHVNEIVTAKPYERRAMIEEAAGISKFRIRQHAIELRLESTRQNLARVDDVLAELDRQAASLKRQAARARRYLRLKEEHRSLLRIYYVAEHRTTQAALENIENDLAVAADQRQGSSEAIGRTDAVRRECEEAVRSGESGVSDLREQLSECDLEIERQNAKKLQTQEQTNSLCGRRDDLEREITSLRERTSLLEVARDESRIGLERLRQEVDIEQHHVAEQEALIGRESVLVREMEGGLESLRHKLLTQINRVSELRNRGSQAEEGERRLQADIRRLNSEEERTRTRDGELVHESQTLASELEQLKTNISDVRSDLERLGEKLAENRAQRETLSQARADREKELISADQRLASLVDLERRRARYTQAVQSLFETIRRDNGSSFRIVGTLADFVGAQPENEKLIESFLGERLQSVVVPTLEDAAQAAAKLSAQGAGRAIFLVAGIQGGQRNLDPETDHSSDFFDVPLDKTYPSGDRILDLLQLPDHIASAFVAAFPDMAGAVVERTIEIAIERSCAETDPIFVTREGEWARAGRVFVGGGEETISSGLLSVKREIAELQARVQALQSQVGAISKDCELAADRGRTFETQMASKEAESRELERTLLEKEMRWAELERDRNRAHQQLRIVEFEISQRSGELGEVNRQKGVITDEIESAERVLKELEAEHERLTAALSARRDDNERLNQSLSELRSAQSARLERLRSSELESARMDREDQEVRRRLDECEAELKRLNQELEISASTLDSIGARAAQLLGERARRATESARAEALLQEAYRQLEDTRRNLDAMRAQAEHLRDEQSKLEVRRAELLATARYVADDCWKELAQDVGELAQRAEPEEQPGHEEGEAGGTDPESLKATIEAMRRRFEELGPVNMMAVEEFQELEQRLEFMRAQRQDIWDSISSTEQALEEIKRRSKDRFHDAFEQINGNFRQSFQELFGGGHGEMRLLDPDNLLDTGIDIVAQPPGKRLQNILLLSGGEKSMTAIALLLAIFRYRPSPFCVLDEVDAQLDDMNVERFSSKVSEMSQGTQFVVITHNKNTMETANVLHGVTMEEPGISKLLSVRLR